MKIPEIQATATAEQVKVTGSETGRVRSTAGTRKQGLTEKAAALDAVQAREVRPESGIEVRLDEQDKAETGGVNAEEVRDLAQTIEQALEAKGVSLKFKVLDDQDTVQVEVVDPETQKVVRKIPSDELIKLAANLREQAGGLLNKMF